MRQVDLDELTYQIFSGLRAWTASRRARIFAPIAKRRDVDIKLAAEQLAAKLRTRTFLDPVAPTAPLGLDRVAKMLEGGVHAFPGAIGALWLSGQREREREAQAAAAILLAKALDPLEILSETALEQFGARVVWFRMQEAPDYAFAARWP